jgi:hypothetical protein
VLLNQRADRPDQAVDPAMFGYYRLYQPVEPSPVAHVALMGAGFVPCLPQAACQCFDGFHPPIADQRHSATVRRQHFGHAGPDPAAGPKDQCGTDGK